jgi:hypothetical protein
MGTYIPMDPVIPHPVDDGGMVVVMTGIIITSKI